MEVLSGGSVLRVVQGSRFKVRDAEERIWVVCTVLLTLNLASGTLNVAL
jgi:hypothetical protein